MYTSTTSLLTMEISAGLSVLRDNMDASASNSREYVPTANMCRNVFTTSRPLQQ